MHIRKNAYSFLRKKDKIKNKDRNFIICLTYFFGAISYFLSLSEMKGISMKCYTRKRLECIYILVTLTFISSLLISISIYMILFKNYKKIHLFIIFFIYLIFYLKDHNNEVLKHGLFNFLGFIFSTLILIILFSIANFLITSIKKKKYFLIILIFSSFIYFIFKFRQYKFSHFSCDIWAKGFNNTFIDNASKDYPCFTHTPPPHSCYLSEIGPFFDFTRIYRPTCLDDNLIEYETKKYLEDIKSLKYLKISKKNHFGYPLTNNEDFKYDLFGTIVQPGNKSFQNKITKNIILMDLYKKNKEKYYPNKDSPEIEILLSKNKGKIKINIKQNKTLIMEKNKILKKIKDKLLYKNILVMFFDSLYRAHFHRKFRKTTKFLNQFFKYEQDYSKKNMTVFQYFKYNSVYYNTDPNLKAAYYGANKYGKGIHFANYFKKNGYIIGRVNAYCGKESVFNKKNPSSLMPAIWDHEGLSLGCIKTFYHRFLVSRLTSLIKKCLFGKDLSQYALEYLESFWITYIEQYKLFLFQSLEGHEPSGELIGYFDEILYNFLNKFYKLGYFKDTFILLFSDHGNQLPGPLYLFNSQDFLTERALPLLLILVPNNEKLYKDNLYEKIKSNQQTFITPFDIYNTLIHLAYGKNKKEYKRKSVSYGGSLFSKLNYKTRICKSSKLKPNIDNFSCKCLLKDFKKN